MTDWTIEQADVIKWAEAYRGEPFHAILCDPPYHLTSITERFGKEDSAPAQYGRDGAFQRVSTGFMGQHWDGGDVAFRAETWAALARHLHPGGFGMAFGGARTFHRMAVAIEDAGLIIHPIIVWCYGSGFPKATRIDTQVDRDAGAEREKIPQGKPVKRMIPGADQNRTGSWIKDNGRTYQPGMEVPATDLARAWEGHRYGLQALKPAVEPVIVFQKPYEGRPVDCITETGAGALNIDGGRIAGSWKWGTQTDIRGGGYGSKRPSDGDIYAQDVESHPSGRWPANFLLTHAPGCRRRGTRRVRGAWSGNGHQQGTRHLDFGMGAKDVVKHTDPDGLETVDDWECVEGCAVAALAAQSGELKSGGHPDRPNRIRNSSEYKTTCYGEYDQHLSRSISDAGTAARFFYQADWSYEVAERLAGADPFHYCAKASGRERNAGLDAMPERARNRVNPGGLEHEPRWAPTKVRNPHPTLKPISLTKYLAALLLPPDAYAPRRVLVPFAGTGSEMLGALLAGFEEIIGVEMEADYCDIARARLGWWADRARWGCSDVETLLATVDEEPDEGPEQLELFGS